MTEEDSWFDEAMSDLAIGGVSAYMKTRLRQEYEGRVKAEAAIARVREACEAHRHGLMSPCAVDIVLQALDGSTE